MGCLCSKGELEDEVVATIFTSTLSGSHGSVKLPSKQHENSNTGSSGSLEKEEKKDFTVAQSFSHVGEHKRRVSADVGAHKKGSNARGSHDMADGLGIGSVPNGLAGEHVAAGWPSWLADVAGEAINGWLPRRGESFEKLDKIGEGTYSHVFRARDLETNKVVAIKKVRFANMDPESVRFMMREIHVLRRLDHPNVIKLEGIITSRKSCNLYLIFEYMEHDLAGLAARSSVRFTEPQIKCYVKQLLEGLDHCHSRGILHRDIKSSNLLVNNNGIPRIADFGLATLFAGDQGQQLTSRVVTLWYRPPELLLGATEYGAAVDLWSSGCILAELFAGRPIMPEELRWNNYTRSSSSVVHLQKSTGRNQSCPMRPYSNLSISTGAALLIPSKISHRRLCLSLVFFLLLNQRKGEQLPHPSKVNSSQQCRLPVTLQVGLNILQAKSMMQNFKMRLGGKEQLNDHQNLSEHTTGFQDQCQPQKCRTHWEMQIQKASARNTINKMAKVLGSQWNYLEDHYTMSSLILACTLMHLILHGRRGTKNHSVMLRAGHIAQ